MNLTRLSTRTLSSLLTHPHNHPTPSTLSPLLSLLSLHPPQHRHASHASEGRANKPPRGPGKRLGAKKSASELVVPGNIIFRQRGTLWYPGENCGMGRDHTIFAREKGFVVYYRDPERHPRRKYIGVVFERGMGLPVPRGAARRRRLGMVERGREMGMETTQAEEGEVGGDVQGRDMRLVAPEGIKQPPNLVRASLPQTIDLRLKQGYMYREANWQIGRAAERAKVKVRVYTPGDRFMAWRKKNARKAKNVEKRALRVKRGGGK